ncbi:rhamnulose-1-phosphate aldolase [Lactovum miscens]|uniref:Rhamnulose-1-phosphate aldolase n=1 Tax=Lactovum miscens TaxID=190387 RepID=A0A841C5D0_9LACT|nr:rhamnulose-1-phosphate aldolase [Lactovum miscens]MBB5887645.1 rhamnulose-1-phosphate aldolase [Lactovum miscens]
MKKNILEASFIVNMCKTTHNLYQHGWDERNGGNISMILSEEEVSEYLDISDVKRVIPTKFDASKLAGKYFIVTGAGKYFKNVIDAPAVNMGIVHVQENGNNLDLLWGYEDGGFPTSELPSHFMTHISRLSVDLDNKVVIHCHATNLLAMTFTYSLDEREFTRILWQMCTESLVVFPDGVGILPWIVPGTNEIGVATAEKMRTSRLVIWPFHGVYGAGKDLDETYGLVETAEKSAQVYTLTQAQGGIKQTLTDHNLRELAEAFHVVPKVGYLE